MNGIKNNYSNKLEYAQSECTISNLNQTVEENIDLKIKQLKKEIERLEESKLTLSPLLAMKIRDIRDAINY